MAWAPERSATYTVKSAYRSLMIQNEHKALEEGTFTDTSATDKQLWSRLWKLKVLPKVRVFWWRVMRGILPVESTLKYRHISSESKCKICLHADEDMMHALLNCTHARRFWNEAPEWLDIKRPDLHPVTWVKDILCDYLFSDSDRAKLVSIMWSIWTSRNNITHDKGDYDPVQSMKLIREALASLDLPQDHARILPGHGWRPPDEGWIKINTDGSIAMEARRGGVGGVARSSSALKAAWCKPYTGITDPIVAEALALRDGVIFAKLRGYDQVILETDSLEMVNLWHSRHDRSVVAPILTEIGEHACSF